jgi:hypothetical protein
MVHFPVSHPSLTELMTYHTWHETILESQRFYAARRLNPSYQQ